MRERFRQQAEAFFPTLMRSYPRGMSAIKHMLPRQFAYRPGTLQISNKPEVACILALPSGRAILPSTTMGLFQ